jgi:hypothetical protein
MEWLRQPPYGYCYSTLWTGPSPSSIVVPSISQTRSCTRASFVIFRKCTADAEDSLLSLHACGRCLSLPALYPCGQGTSWESEAACVRPLSCDSGNARLHIGPSTETVDEASKVFHRSISFSQIRNAEGFIRDDGSHSCKTDARWLETTSFKILPKAG